MIAVAPNGARKMHADHPALPLAADEIARTARSCVNSGAALLHLHVRNPDGQHTLDASRYDEAISAVRSAVGPDMVIQITTEAVGRYKPAEQMAVVERVRPEACSIALREMTNAGDDESEDRYVRFLADCRSAGIWVQHILYDRNDIERFKRLWTEGKVGERPSVLFVVGRNAVSGQADPLDLIEMLSLFGASNMHKADWTVCGFGVNETRILAAAVAFGGHVRVGFENSLLRPDGSVAQSNEERVSDCASLIGSLGRRPMTAQVLREQIQTLRIG